MHTQYVRPKDHHRVREKTKQNMRWPFGLSKQYDCYLYILKIPHLIELDKVDPTKVRETAAPLVWLIPEI